MNIASQTISGKRGENEDTLLAKKENECFILAVADGMGGHAGGKVASKLTIDIARSYFNQFQKNPSFGKIRDSLLNIIEDAHAAIKEKGEKSEDLKGLGTTLTILLGYNKKYAIANIGDSRAYILNNNSINQITNDHTYLSQYKKLNPDKKISSKLKERYSQVLTKCIDGKGNESDIFPGEDDLYHWEDNDVIMLCSDGLILDNGGSVEKNIKNIINKSNSMKDACTNLVDYALRNGSEDNISVAIAAPDRKIGQNKIEEDKSVEYDNKFSDYKPALSFILTSILILFILVFVIFKLMSTLGENYNRKSSDKPNVTESIEKN